jgi:carbamoyltransferase
MPWRAAAHCLARAGVDGAHLEAVALSHKPLLHLDRLLSSALAFAPGSWPRFAHDAASWAPSSALERRLRARLGFTSSLLFFERAEALVHAALPAAASQPCAVLVAAGSGEWADAALGVAGLDGITLSRQLDYPHGLGPLWQAFGWYLGLRDPWREIPPLAETGRPRFASAIAAQLLDLKADGSLRLDLGYFAFCAGLEPVNARFAALLGGPPRRSGEPPGERESDIAASLQTVTIEVLRRMAAEARARAGVDDLCLVGSAALNPAAVAALRENAPGALFADSPPPPIAAAVGAAAAAWSRGLRRERPALDSAAWTAPAPAGGAAPAEERTALRRMGFAAALAALALLIFTRPSPWFAGFELGLAFICALGAWRAPETLGELAAAAGLSAVYFLAVTPLSLVTRTLGSEFLDERWQASGTYWTDRRPEGEGLRALRRTF